MIVRSTVASTTAGRSRERPKPSGVRLTGHGPVAAGLTRRGRVCRAARPGAETLAMLEERLVDFTGTVLLVSRDRSFLDNVVTSTPVFEPAGDGAVCRVREYVGGYSHWLRQVPPSTRPIRARRGGNGRSRSSVSSNPCRRSSRRSRPNWPSHMRRWPRPSLTVRRATCSHTTGTASATSNLGPPRPSPAGKPSKRAGRERVHRDPDDPPGRQHPLPRTLS